MGWSIGFDERWQRDIGYGVPAYCDHPKCDAEIDRGLAYVCGGEPFGGETGCGLFFCPKHQYGADQRCLRCVQSKPPYKRPAPEHPRWIHHKLTDPSWRHWRAEQTLAELARLSTIASPPPPSVAPSVAPATPNGLPAPSDRDTPRTTEPL